MNSSVFRCLHHRILLLVHLEGKKRTEIVEFSGIVPCDNDLQPLATPEEAAEHEARMIEEAKIERLCQARFTQEVELAAWYDIKTCVGIKLMILRHFYSSNWPLLKYCADSMNESSCFLFTMFEIALFTSTGTCSLAFDFVRL